MKVSALTLSLCYVLSVKLLHKTNNGSNNLKKILIEATTENCSLDWLRCIKYWSYNKTWKIRLFFFISLPHSYESNILWARYCYTPTEHIWITKKNKLVKELKTFSLSLSLKFSIFCASFSLLFLTYKQEALHQVVKSQNESLSTGLSHNVQVVPVH